MADHKEEERIRSGLAVLVDDAPFAPEFDQLTATRARPIEQHTHRPLVIASLVAAAIASVFIAGAIWTNQGGAPSETPPVGSESPASIALSADESARSLLASLDSDLMVQVVDDDGATLGVLTPTLDLQLRELQSGELGGLTVDASATYVAAQPTADFERTSATELWVGPINGDLWQLSEGTTPFTFHDEEPALLAYFDNSETQGVLKVVDLAGNDPTSAEIVATIPDAVWLHGWTEAGIIVGTQDDAAIIVTPTGDRIAVDPAITASSPNTVLVRDSFSSKLGIVDIDSQTEIGAVDLGEGKVIFGRWLPEHETYAITTLMDDTADHFTAMLIDIHGNLIAETQLPGSTTPILNEWGHLIAFASREGMALWDPTTGQLGDINATTTQFVPLTAVSP